MFQNVFNVFSITVFLGFGIYKITCYMKTKVINSSAKRIINIVFFYLIALLILFELDCYNLPSLLLKYNIDYSAWLGYIISILSVLCFNFALIIYLPEFTRISTKNKELVENKKYKLICSISNYRKRLFNNSFDLNISLPDNRKKFILLEVYKNDKKINNFNDLNRKINSATLQFTTTIFDNKPEISLIIENNNKKYLVTIETKIQRKMLTIKDIFFDFYLDL